MENNFKPILGHEFQFKTKAKAKLGFDGQIFCKVLEIENCRRLVYSWRGGPGNDSVTLDSIVTWTLEPKGEGTRLTLEHSGFKGLRNYLPYIIMNMGWQKIAKRFLNYLNEQK